ncbi:uncharacterized protein LOC127751241 [Frankliniella occidentalis]|uniref:Uncharacterized protein LOC127751241 n=1 Tax=Frankliniella occidentalis TaxID=133901 RepID=A0A9C6X780_FRAOC|nr:uncharacterized protein LOC127751241 [Frankliniella occidentalis]
MRLWLVLVGALLLQLLSQRGAHAAPKGAPSTQHQRHHRHGVAPGAAGLVGAALQDGPSAPPPGSGAGSDGGPPGLPDGLPSGLAAGLADEHPGAAAQVAGAAAQRKDGGSNASDTDEELQDLLLLSGKLHFMDEDQDDDDAAQQVRADHLPLDRRLASGGGDEDEGVEVAVEESLWGAEAAPPPAPAATHLHAAAARPPHRKRSNQRRSAQGSPPHNPHTFNQTQLPQLQAPPPNYDHDPLVVMTKKGRVRGVTLRAATGKDVDAWLGIPYAQKPIGEWESPAHPHPGDSESTPLKWLVFWELNFILLRGV